MSVVLKIEDLNVSYGTHQVLHSINLSITSGKIIGVVGQVDLVNQHFLKLF